MVFLTKNSFHRSQTSTQTRKNALKSFPNIIDLAYEIASKLSKGYEYKDFESHLINNVLKNAYTNSSEYVPQCNFNAIMQFNSSILSINSCLFNNNNYSYRKALAEKKPKQNSTLISCDTSGLESGKSIANQMDSNGLDVISMDSISIDAILMDSKRFEHNDEMHLINFD